MLFYKGLEDIIFTRNQLFKCDELVILSGYLGPTPVERLKELPFHTTVIYGMYGAEGIQSRIHTALLQKHQSIDNINILYSTMPVHSKCYVWKNKGEVVHALVGSANFSVNGLTIPYKEVLAETTVDTFEPLDDYLKLVKEKAISCENAVVRKNKSKARQPHESADFNKDICSLPLYSTKNGNKYVPAASGINWCLSSNANVTPGDGYVPIPAECIRKYPQLFPKKQIVPVRDPSTGRSQRHNDAIEVLWDDGTIMTCLLEGNSELNLDGIRGGPKDLYPKNLASHPRKNVLGNYLRKRLGVTTDHKVSIADLAAYGRDTIDISLMGEGIYYFDFSV